MQPAHLSAQALNVAEDPFIIGPSVITILRGGLAGGGVSMRRV